MEIPESALRHIPDEYEVTSAKKGHKRYRTPEIESLLAQLTEAEDGRDSALRDIMRKIFFTFDKRYSEPSLSGHSQQRPPSLTRPQMLSLVLSVYLLLPLSKVHLYNMATFSWQIVWTYLRGTTTVFLPSVLSYLYLSNEQSCYSVKRQTRLNTRQ